MKKLLTVFGIILLATAWAISAPMAKEAKYVGVKSCGKCHKKKKEGEQLAVWEKSEHAEAYQLLGTPKAAEAAKKIGFSGDPQKSEACLVCHTTGYGKDKQAFSKGFKVEQGVQCEACHGAGSNYRKKKTMKAISDERGADRKGTSATAKKTGLLIPDEKACKGCHSEQTTFNGKTYKNPSYKAFDFKKSFEKIKHPVPR